MKKILLVFILLIVVFFASGCGYTIQFRPNIYFDGALFNRDKDFQGRLNNDSVLTVFNCSSKVFRIVVNKREFRAAYVSPGERKTVYFNNYGNILVVVKATALDKKGKEIKNSFYHLSVYSAGNDGGVNAYLELKDDKSMI